MVQQLVYRMHGSFRLLVDLDPKVTMSLLFQRQIQMIWKFHPSLQEGDLILALLVDIENL